MRQNALLIQRRPMRIVKIKAESFDGEVLSWPPCFFWRFGTFVRTRHRTCKRDIGTQRSVSKLATT